MEKKLVMALKKLFIKTKTFNEKHDTKKENLKAAQPRGVKLYQGFSRTLFAFLCFCYVEFCAKQSSYLWQRKAKSHSRPRPRSVLKMGTQWPDEVECQVESHHHIQPGATTISHRELGVLLFSQGNAAFFVPDYLLKSIINYVNV